VQVQSTRDLDTVETSARSVAQYSRKANDALTEENRLAGAQIAKAEQVELERGWLDERDLFASPEETARTRTTSGGTRRLAPHLRRAFWRPPSRFRENVSVRRLN
jgi:hypothetical protein